MRSNDREGTPRNPTVPFASGDCELVDGRYQIRKTLGKGAMGIVYLAHDTVLQRDVALKVMVAEIANDPELRRRLEREAQAVARTAHPNVVTVFDLGTDADGSPYITMELLKGQDLKKVMSRLSLDRKLAITVQVLAGLAHAHEARIVHRDIKPANIFITKADGTAKIMDFGVARLSTGSQTGTGHIVGTADYMSPEQVRGANVDGRSDLFSVGSMLFELLTGERPFHAESMPGIFYKIVHEEPNLEQIRTRREFQGLLPILRKALAKPLEGRYQAAEDFAADLRAYLEADTKSRQGSLDADGPSRQPVAPETTPDAMGMLSPTLPDRTAVSPETRGLSARWWWVIIPVTLLVFGAAGLGLLHQGSRRPEVRGAASASVSSPRVLNYCLTFSDAPSSELVPISESTIFKPGDRVWLHVSSPQPGHLYILNEGPNPRGGRPSYNLLFPAPGNAAPLEANEQTTVSLYFDEQAGRERLWMLWAAEPLDQLEAVRYLANEKNQGAITEPAQIRRLQDLLASHSASPVSHVVGERGISLRGTSQVLAKSVVLEHR